MDQKQVSEVLNFAIEKEQEAVDLYTNLSAKTNRSQMKIVFEQFAAEERGHKAKLQNLRNNQTLLEKNLLEVKAKVPDLKIGDYLVDVDVAGELDYQQSLILAMKNEKAAFRLYSDLAAQAGGDLQQLFLGLAQEEARHKLRFEVEYDDNILKDN